jgi:hypothetical protein
MPKAAPAPTPAEINAAFGTTDGDWKKIIPKKDENAPTDFPPVWAFDLKEHKTLEGLYTQLKTNVGPNHSKQYLIENAKDHVVYTVWGTTLLDKHFLEIGAGTEVKIVLDKMAKGSSGREYYVFEVWSK